VFEKQKFMIVPPHGGAESFQDLRTFSRAIAFPSSPDYPSSARDTS
jgi:hypothetical protein